MMLPVLQMLSVVFMPMLMLLLLLMLLLAIADTSNGIVATLLIPLDTGVTDFVNDVVQVVLVKLILM